MQKAVTNQQFERPRILASGELELIVVLLLAPPLLFPSFFPSAVTLVALCALVLPFLMRYWRTGELIRYSHANIPVLSLLLFFLPLSLVVSPLPLAVSWPRFTTLAWSIVLFFTFANWPQDVTGPAHGRTRFTLPTKLYLALGVVVAVIGLVGMRSVDKLFYLPLPDLLAAWWPFGDGLATNEIAGVLTLFAPFAAAIAIGALQTNRMRSFWITAPLAILFLAVAVLAQSRTALAAIGVSLALVTILLLRPGWKWLVAGLVVAGIGLLVASVTGLTDRFIFAGANSWDSVVGPRLSVWQQGLFALRDFALWGTGLGVFGTLAIWFYPLAPAAQAKILEDAHNLYLQSMLDLGTIGGLVFVGVLVYALIVLARMARKRRPRTMGRAWAVGLLAALVAHMLYSVTDAVALGTLAGIPLWCLLGLTMARTRDTKPAVNYAVAAVLLVSAVALVGGLVWATYPTNEAARQTADALLRGANQAEATQAVAATAETNCALHWQEGLLYQAQGQLAERDASWASLLGCTDRYTHFMPILTPDNSTLAQEAINRQPSSSVGYFWLAELTSDADPAAAVELYRQGLALAPQDGLRWHMLGNLLVETDLDAALAAYLQACRNGDPGANGCLQAGAVAERQGNIEAAISYYRLSKFSGSLERADELEQMLAGQE